jgi:hypothetical protein
MAYLEGILPHRPAEPEGPQLGDAFDVLDAAVRATEAFFTTFDLILQQKGPTGASTETDQDLLRAALAFACAGLDATIKQLVKDALPSVLKRDEGAMEEFASFLDWRLRKPGPSGDFQFDTKFIAEILVKDAPHPRVVVEQRLIEHLTRNSLQSKDELLRVAAYFAIRPQDLVDNVKRLSEIFFIRNQIIHEMDVDLTQKSRSQRPRDRGVMVACARDILTAACRFYQAVEAKLGKPVLGS